MPIHIVHKKEEATKITIAQFADIYPKGCKNTTSAEVARIELWINKYPKRMFNYLTPEIIYHCG